MSRPKPSKHASIFSALNNAIRLGRLKPGERLPSEADLMRDYGVSRITAGRALRDLQAAGLVHRRVGSGTYVTYDAGDSGHAFGLLIPGLGDTEIFEPICHGMMASPLARHHALVWGSAPAATMSTEVRAWQLCEQFIARGVAGVFFAPLEMTSGATAVNRRIANALRAARIPIVLLDRPLAPYPDPGDCDLVGLDHRHAAHILTRHLVTLGCQRVAFVGRPDGAHTVDEREAGYREALYLAGHPIDRARIHRIDPADAGLVGVLATQQVDGIVCANDKTAGYVMKALIQSGRRVPADVRVVGIDDVGYATLLPVPLTTVRQPTLQIGESAFLVMLDRVNRPDLPPRETRLHGTLVVRESCGAAAV